jgi:hypothetical protein
MPNVMVETGSVDFLVYDLLTTAVTHFDGLTLFYYYTTSNITLYQSNQFTLHLGSQFSALDFFSNARNQSYVDSLVEDLEAPETFDTCGDWILGIDSVASENMFVAFYHGETRIGFDPDCTYLDSIESYKAIGLAFSLDGGKTFKKEYPNEVITSKTLRSGDGTYFQSSVIPNYRYIMYLENGVTCLARASVSCLTETNCWYKYYNGTWNEPGINGSCDYIVPFQNSTSKYVSEIAASDGNYLMAVEVSKYGGTHFYFTRSTNPEGPWTLYTSAILYHSAYNSPFDVVAASIIHLTATETGFHKVIQEGEEFVIAYTLTATNVVNKTESLVVYQPITIWGNPTNWLGVTITPIYTYTLSINSTTYFWTTNFVYTPYEYVASENFLGYMATWYNITGVNEREVVYLYSCYQSVTKNRGSQVLITDVQYTSELPNYETASPACSNSAVSEYIGFALVSQNTTFNMQKINLCAVSGYSMQFHFLALPESYAPPCYGMGTVVNSFWIFASANGH